MISILLYFMVTSRNSLFCKESLDNILVLNNVYFNKLPRIIHIIKNKFHDHSHLNSFRITLESISINLEWIAFVFKKKKTHRNTEKQGNYELPISPWAESCLADDVCVCIWLFVHSFWYTSGILLCMCVSPLPLFPWLALASQALTRLTRLASNLQWFFPTLCLKGTVYRISTAPHTHMKTWIRAYHWAVF